MSSGTPSPSSLPLKPQRVLACVLCQQRKVKCDRKFPCANCIRSRAQCMPASLSERRRRRKFPERELLERLRKYEDLMRQNNVSFEPLRDPSAEKKKSDVRSEHDSDVQDPEPGAPESAPTVKSERRNVWHTMSRVFRDPENDSDSSHDDVREAAVKKAWDQTIPKDDNLLFGPRDATADLSGLHPDAVQIFRLWQIYIDNVNPLLKVTHTPTLQPRIIEAASNISNISPTLEALMFGIYSMAVTSIDGQDCQAVFCSSKEDLLTKFQYGCQQSLYKCAFLRSSDRECLTALYLYLISVVPTTVPQSLYSMLGVAFRIAHRMGIQNESVLAKYPVVEAEMRRRLWWSMVLFEYRISEISCSTTSTLDPTWDCRVPLNVNDSDLRPDMKQPPPIQGISTETLFAVVRSEVGDYIRHSMMYLEFSNPALKFLAKRPRNASFKVGDEMDLLDQAIENKYLSICNEENPLHYMTMWITRAYIAKWRLFEHLVNYSNCSSTNQTDSQRDDATFIAIKVLESDTRIMTAPSIKGFCWFNRLYFPLPAYLQIAQDLRMRPTTKIAPRAWDVLADSYDAWFRVHNTEIGPLFHIFAKIILQAWDACEAASKQSGEILTPPKVVTSVRSVMSERTGQDPEHRSSNLDLGLDDSSMMMPPVLQDMGLLFPTEMQNGFVGMRPDVQPGMSAHTPNQFDWGALNGGPGWPGF